MAPTIVPTKFTVIDKLSAKVNAMNSSVSKFAEDFSRKFDAAGKTAFRLGRQTAIVGAMIAAPLVVAAKSAVDFEEKMSNVSTLIDTSKESIQKMGDEVLSLSTKLPVPIEELTTSLYDIRSAGISAEKQFETLDSAARLSVAGLSSVAEATNISTSALNAFKSEGLSAAQTNDILFKTVKYGKTTISELSTGFGATAGTIQSAGVQLADFSAATAALTTVGTPATQAQTQLRAAIVALQKPTKEMDKIFKKLGVTSEKELIAREGGMVGAFDAINEAGQEMGMNLSKAWSSTEAVAAVTSLTGATKDTYLKAMDDMSNGANALNEAFDKQSKTGKSSMQVLKNNMEALSITVGQALLPVINDLVAAIMPYIKAGAEWVKNNKGLVSTIVKVAAGVVGFAFAISAASFAIGIYQKAMVVAKAVTLAFNAVAMVNPFVLMIAGAVALGYALYKLKDAFSGVSVAEKLNSEVRQRALDKTIDQRVEIMQLFNTLRRAKQGTDEYRNALAEVEKMQPGITEKYNLQKKSVEALNQAEKDLTATIMKRAMEEARAELIKEKMKAAIQAKESGPTGALGLAADIQSLLGNDSLKKSGGELQYRQLMAEANILSQQQAQATGQAVNPEKSKNQQLGQAVSQKIDLWINGEQQGNMMDLNGKKIDAPFSNLPSMGTTR